MHQIVEGEVNIEYMYAFANGSDAAAVLKSDDPARVIDILKGSGFDVYSADEAYRLICKRKSQESFLGFIVGGQKWPPIIFYSKRDQYIRF